MTPLKIITLHYAGGNAYSYRFLDEYFHSHTIINLELPGRGRRIREDLLNDAPSAIHDLFLQVKEAVQNDSYILFGHSMGALMSFAVAAKMTSISKPPLKIVVSGNPGPGIRENRAIYALSDDDFIQEVAKLGGMHKDLLNNQEIMTFFIPIMKSDFQIVEEFDVSEFGPLAVPIHAVMGDKEDYVDDIENWKTFTKSDFKKICFLVDIFLFMILPKPWRK